MKKVYCFTLFFLLLNVCIYAQKGFSLRIESPLRLTYEKMKEDVLPGAPFLLSFDKDVPPGFSLMMKVANDTSMLLSSDTVGIKTNAFAAKWGSKRNILIAPEESTAEITLSFQLDGKRIPLVDHAAEKPTAVDILVVSFTNGESRSEGGGDPCEVIKPGFHYFIPSIEQVITDLEDKKCSNCKNNYKVTYDLSSGEPKLCYYKRQKCDCPDTTKASDCNCTKGNTYCYVPLKNGRRIRPRVGDNIGFHIYGYYPSFDKLTIDFAFESRNQELKDQFSAAFSQPAPANAETPENEAAEQAEEPKATEGKSTTLKQAADFVDRIQYELKEYHNFLLRKSPSQDQVQLGVSYINDKLNSYCIKLATFSPPDLVDAISRYIKGIDDDDGDDTRKKILETAKIAAMYYGYILNYSTMKIPVMQVPNEDVLKYTVVFFKRDTKLYTGNYRMLIRGGWKIDFSTGIVFNNLNDKEYVIKYDTIDLDGDGGDDDPTGQIDEKDKGKFNANVAIMSHIYPRTGTRVNVGGTFGFVFQGASVLKYVGGVSVMLGYEQRFVVSWGAIAGAVDRLDSSYSDVYDNPAARSRFSAISTSIPTVKKWNFGQFVSLTYNFGGTTVGK